MALLLNFMRKWRILQVTIANGAVYIISAELLETMGADCNYVSDFSTEVLHRFKGHIFSHEISDVFLDVGTPDRYEKANKLRI